MDRKKKEENVYRRINEIYKGYRRWFLIIIATIISNIVICFLQPLVRTFLFDKGIVSGNWKIVFICVMGMLFFYIIDTVDNYLQLYCSSKIQNLVNYKISSAGLNKILRLPLAEHEEHGTLTLIENLQRDANTVSSIVNKNIIVLISNLFGVIGGIVGLLVINWKLTLVSIIIVLLKIIHISYFSTHQKNVQSKYIYNQSQKSFLNSDISLNIWNIKLWNLYSKISFKMRQIMRNEMKFVLRSQLISETQSFINKGIDFLLNLNIYILGTVLFINQQLSVGELMAFLSSIDLVSVPVALISYIKNELAKVEPSLKRINDLMLLEEEGDTKKSCTISLPTKITFSHVSYSYNKTEIFNDISFTVKKGERIAICGLNGSGKSTLLNLLLRLLSPSNGQILFDSTPIDYFDIDEYRNLFCVVPQVSTFFDDSVENNLFLKSKINFQNGGKGIFKNFFYENEILARKMLSNGSNFSGGERQKIALLRAALKAGKILILDEATSNYDLHSSEKYNEYIERFFLSYSFVFFISHKPDEIKLADKIIYLHQGEMRVFSDYSELIKACNEV